MKIYVYVMVLFTLGFVPIYYGATLRLRRMIGPAFFLSVAATYLMAFSAPWPIMLLVMAGIAATIGIGSRVDVACRYVLLVVLLPAAAPIFAIGGHVIGQFTPVDAAGFGAVAAGIAARQRSGGPKPRGFRPEEAMVLLFILIFGVLSVRLEGVSLLIRTVLSQVMLMALPFWIVRRNIRSREDLQLMAACIGVAAAILSVMALYEHRAGWALFDTVTARMSDGQMASARSAMMRGGALRASTTLGSPIEFGMVLMLGLLGTLSARRLYTVPIVWVGMLALTFLGVLATQSRGALLACGVGVFFVLLVQRRYVASSLVAAAALAAYGMLLALSLSSMRVAAFMGAGTRVGLYKDYRTLLLERGIEEGRKHPLLGLSSDSVVARLADITQGEQIVDLVNTYLHIFLISGLIGLFACLVCLAFIYQALWQKVAGSLSSSGELARAFVLAGLTGVLMQLAGTSFYGRVVPVLMILLAAARVIRATDRKFYRRPVVPVLWEVGRAPDTRPSVRQVPAGAA